MTALLALVRKDILLYLHDRRALNQGCDAGSSLHQSKEFRVGHEPYDARYERPEAVIDLVEIQSVEERRIGGHAKTVDLTDAVFGAGVAAKETLDHNHGEARNVAARKDVFVAPDRPNLAPDPADCFGVFGAYASNAG